MKNIWRIISWKKVFLYGVKSPHKQIKSLIKGRIEEESLKDIRHLMLIGEKSIGKKSLIYNIANEEKLEIYSIVLHLIKEDRFLAYEKILLKLRKRIKNKSVIVIDDLNDICFGDFDGIEAINKFLEFFFRIFTNPNQLVVTIFHEGKPEIKTYLSTRIKCDIVIDFVNLCENDRMQIFSDLSEDFVCLKETEKNQLIKLTEGYNYEKIRKVVREAKLDSINQDKELIDYQLFENSIDAMIMGKVNDKKKFSEEQILRVAYHEVGHVILALHLKEENLHKVSIIERYQINGFTQFLPENSQIYSKTELENKICIFLAGYATEIIFLSESSTGCHDDLIKATEIAEMMVKELGMTSVMIRSFDRLNCNKKNNEVGEVTLEKIDLEVNNILIKCQDKSESVIKENEGLVKAMVQELLVRKVLKKEEILDIKNRFSN
jgi:hypothetical protein